jgi:hypothetical protein
MEVPQSLNPPLSQLPRESARLGLVLGDLQLISFQIIIAIHVARQPGATRTDEMQSSHRSFISFCESLWQAWAERGSRSSRVRATLSHQQRDAVLPARARALGTLLSLGDAPALAGMGRPLGDDGVRCRCVRSVSAETLVPGSHQPIQRPRPGRRE